MMELSDREREVIRHALEMYQHIAMPMNNETRQVLGAEVAIARDLALRIR